MTDDNHNLRSRLYTGQSIMGLMIDLILVVLLALLAMALLL